MKLVAFLSVSAACALLTPAVSMQAAPKAKMSEKARIAAMVKDPEMARAALHAMMQDREIKRMMARELGRDREFRALYSAEVGSGAPHQERNPSDHPELFERKKP